MDDKRAKELSRSIDGLTTAVKKLTELLRKLTEDGEEDLVDPRQPEGSKRMQG